MTKTHRILSRDEIIELIAQGKCIIIYEKSVLNLTYWLDRHPGGKTAVYHMVGRDATDEMKAYHDDETIAVFNKWKVGEINYYWENLLPPIQGAIYNGRKGIGYPPNGVEIQPVVPQNEIINVKHFKKREETIVDPKLIVQEYDNDLTRHDLEEFPTLDYATQQKLRDEYNMLHAEIIERGFYQCDYWNYARELTKILALFLYSFSFLKTGHLFLSAFFMGMAWQQMTFIAHDAGHISISHHYQIDNIFGILIADWFGGLSLGWWKRNHNVHHIITNDPVHDPDIQHLPFFAVSTRLFNDVYSTYYDKFLWFDAFAKKVIPIQNFMYYPILCFGRFNLYRLSWTYLLAGEGPRKGRAAWFRYFEIAGLSFFFYWFFWVLVYKSIDNWADRFQFVMVSHVTTMLVHVQITLSHFAMSTADLGVSESFPQRQIRTTMDVDCPEWLDFLHGGLQFQAIHHLFPRLPRHNFRRVQPYVIDFCSRVGLQYSIYGFGKGNQIVISKLGQIAKQCSIMLEATKKFKEHPHEF